jgi:hypothetical protein
MGGIDGGFAGLGFTDGAPADSQFESIEQHAKQLLPSSNYSWPGKEHHYLLLWSPCSSIDLFTLLHRSSERSRYLVDHAEYSMRRNQRYGVANVCRRSGGWEWTRALSDNLCVVLSFICHLTSHLCGRLVLSLTRVSARDSVRERRRTCRRRWRRSSCRHCPAVAAMPASIVACSIHT